MKTLQSVKNSLKFKAGEHKNVLTVRIGSSRFVVPASVHLLADDRYVFLSYAASANVYRIDGRQIVPLPPDVDATEAYSRLNPPKNSNGHKQPVSMPGELEKALAQIPPGYRLSPDKNGSYRIVRTRCRRSSNGHASTIRNSSELR